MTPKEKAKELVDKFNLPTGLMSRERKQCALIAVDEILTAIKICWDEKGAFDQYKYFEEVKKELENL